MQSVHAICQSSLSGLSTPGPSIRARQPVLQPAWAAALPSLAAGSARSLFAAATLVTLAKAARLAPPVKASGPGRILPGFGSGGGIPSAIMRNAIAMSSASGLRIARQLDDRRARRSVGQHLRVGHGEGGPRGGVGSGERTSRRRVARPTRRTARSGNARVRCSRYSRRVVLPVRAPHVPRASRYRSPSPARRQAPAMNQAATACR